MRALRAQRRSQSRARGRAAGGVVGYPLGQLNEEVAYIAYHFHWPMETILDLEHRDRRHWVTQIASLNQRANEA
ncbi:hypothetical protein BH759_13950 [Ralstonia solanacearum]|nr:hypothetical protein BH759_13950 [Ralstonia solanacearum]